MQLLLIVAIFVVTIHQVLGEDCTGVCDRVRCAQVTSCPPGNYKKLGGTCNCCSSCVKYQGVGESCEERECLPGELVCNEKKVCQSTYVPKFCDHVRCISHTNCTDGKVLLPRDVEKCRCCATCSLPNETENPRCKNGNYVREK